jgi:hypothetical protein
VAHLHRVIAACLALTLPLYAYAMQCTQYTAAGSPWMATKLAVAQWVKTNVYEANPSTCFAGGQWHTATYSVYDAGDGSGYSIIRHTPCGPDTEYGITFFSRTGDYCQSPEELACLALKDFDAYITVPGRKLPGASMCSDAGCTVTLARTLIYVKDKNTGAETTQGAGTYTGAACNYSAATDAAKDPCPKGAKGTVNGVEVCVPYDPNKNVVESVKSGTSTSTVTATTPEGATSTTSSTTAETSSSTRSGDTVSTTTTRVTTNPDGSTTKTESTEQKPAESFCKENPTSPLCRESTFAGSCSANFTCTGDAVMCATARAVNEQKCLLDKQSPEATLYEQSKVNGTATGVQTANHAITSASFDSSNALGASAQCIANRSVTVMGSSITLPFSDICPYLAHLGTLLLAVSWIMAFVIVGKG